MKELHKLMHEFSEHAGKDGELNRNQFVNIMQTVFPMFAQGSASGMVASTEGVDFNALFEAFDGDSSGKLDFRVRTTAWQCRITCESTFNRSLTPPTTPVSTLSHCRSSQLG